MSRTQTLDDELHADDNIATKNVIVTGAGGEKWETAWLTQSVRNGGNARI